MRVLVTGVDGFTGRYVAPLLAAAGCEVHGLVQAMPAVPVAGAAALHVADLLRPDQVARAVAEVGPERVLHLAAIAFVASDPAALYAVNVIGTRHLLGALAALPAPPRAVLLASSANVYGNAREGALDERTPPEPANDYAVSKLAMEQVARLFAAQLPIVVCRPFNYTGVGQAEAFLLPKIVAHARRRAAGIALGNLDVARDFSDVRDVAAIYADLLLRDAAVGRTFNVCSGRARSLREVLAMVERLSGHALAVRVDPALVRAREVKTLRGDPSALDALLGLSRPRIDLEDTLRWMLEDDGGADPAPPRT